MKRSHLAIWPILGLAFASAQAENQSVAELVQGSEFRYTKGNIDIQALSTIIADRQKAISYEVLHRYLMKNQAGALSQNLLTERLIDQLLNNHTPKEITQGLYTYTMETFALGMMALALDSSKLFGLPKACAPFSELAIGKGLLTDACRDSLRQSGFAPLLRIDSLWPLGKSAGDSKSANSQIRALWKGYNKSPPTLSKIHRHYLMDLAYLVALDSSALFGRTLFRSGVPQAYVNRDFKIQARTRWQIDSQLINAAYTELKSQLFDAADNQRKVLQEQLRVSTLIEYATADESKRFSLTKLAVELKQITHNTINLDSSCNSFSQYASAPDLINEFTKCKDFIRDKLNPLQRSDSILMEFNQQRFSLSQNPQILKLWTNLKLKNTINKIDTFLNSTATNRIEKIDLASDTNGLIEIKTNANSASASIQKLIDSIKVTSDIDTGSNIQIYIEKEIARISNELSENKCIPCGSVFNGQIISLRQKTPEIIGSDTFLKVENQLIDIRNYIDSILNLYRVIAKTNPRALFSDSLEIYRRFASIAGGDASSSRSEFFIREVLGSLSKVITRDTQAVNILVAYDRYLNLWLINGESNNIRDSLSLLFLQHYLPALKNLSYTDSSIKSLYKSSISLVNYVSSIKTSDTSNLPQALKPLTKWLATYSTRKRSQNLQSALQLLRDNDPLFATIVADSTTREWFWMVTNGLDIDTMSDIISMDIPKMLVNIEKKYMTEAKSGFWIYPVLDIGIMSAFSVHRDTTDWLQMASEKVGIGFQIWKAKTCPSEALIEDPWNVSGGCSGPFINKVGLELFGSGLLYNTTNLKTGAEFNDALFSAGLAINFKLGLTARAAYGLGVRDGKIQHYVGQLAMDVPLADYLLELSKK